LKRYALNVPEVIAIVIKFVKFVSECPVDVIAGGGKEIGATDLIPLYRHSWMTHSFLCPVKLTWMLRTVPEK
jgi:hypothetical protein